MLGLHSLPYEVLANVISNIDFGDVFNLAMTCKGFGFLTSEESMCKSILQSKIPYSNEFVVAMSSGGSYARALRRAAKRRNALTAVSPYTVATIGFCDAYIYHRGTLCYILDDTMRILDLHNSGHRETVVSIPKLLKRALSDTQESNKGAFQILHFSDNIISCVYRSVGPDSTMLLIAFNAREQTISLVEELDSIDRIFVRHNREFLYYGTHSEMDADGHKKWMIRGYDFRSRKWFPEIIRLTDMAGSEINSTVCFEIHGKYFYALSNQTSFEVEEIDWTSFYHCIRFPLDSPCEELLEKTENKDMWRRQHQEGPLDERWMFLQLYVDETDGELRILESRKEWYLGSSRSQRNYYITDIVWPESKNGDLDICSQPDLSNDPPSPLAPTYAASTSTSHITFSGAPTLSPEHSRDLFDNSTLPDCQLLRLRRKDDHPNYLEAPPRMPQNIHPGDDGSAKPTFTLAKTRLRTYHTSSSTFLDLVDDPLPTDWTCTQRLRLRAGSRRRGPPLRDPETGLLRRHSQDLPTALEELYRKDGINFWPAAQSPEVETRDEQLDDVYRLLNPPTHLGNVEGTADERSMVYVTGSTKPQALIFVGFDPAIKLRGVKRWRGLTSKGIGEGPHIDGRATGPYTPTADARGGGAPLSSQSRTYVDLEEKTRMVTIDRKESEAVRGDLQASLSATETMIDMEVFPVAETGNSGARARGERKSWIWVETAMYCDIGLGLNFDFDPSHMGK